MKTKGYKIVKMYVEEQKVLCDIAVFVNYVKHW